jgi:hypothetical protein
LSIGGPILVSFASDFNASLSAFNNAPTSEQQRKYLNELNQLREHFSTMYNICMIRHTSNTADPFYEAENQYFDESLPEFEALSTPFLRSTAPVALPVCSGGSFWSATLYACRACHQNIQAFGA